MNPDIFSSQERFADSFKQGLVSLLHDFNELGAFILVLANVSFDPELQQDLERKVKGRYQLLKRSFNRSPNQFYLDDVEDDRSVFRKLLRIGMDGQYHTEFRDEGPWEVQFNQLRSLRPTRIADTKVDGIYADYEVDGFHFNKPFLIKEIIWEGSLAGCDTSIYYNKFPFMPMHCLVVPERESGKPQFLHQDDLRYLWSLCEQLGETMPDVRFAYNSYGANASINNLHFHMFVRRKKLPLLRDEWAHNGGKKEYPVGCCQFASFGESWTFISGLHRQEVSYNLVVEPGRLYCLPRRRQGSYTHAAWNIGFAWYEMAGGIAAVRRDVYKSLSVEQITQEMELLELRDWNGDLL
jgi:diadenosine tetraphosphate (Ap4A) HIT family hydrolase